MLGASYHFERGGGTEAQPFPSWAQANRYFPGLTCEQEKQNGLEQKDCGK